MLKLENDQFFEHKFIGEKLNIAVCILDGKCKSLKSAPKVFSPKAKEIIISKAKQTNDFFELRNFYRQYLNSKTLLKPKTLNNYLYSNAFPITFLRALSIYVGDTKIIEKLSFNEIINYRNQKMTFPNSKKELLNPKLAYLCGVIFGDGYLSKNLLKINDGHHNPQKLSYSKTFLENVSELLHELFNKQPKNITQKGNQFELILVSKPISKFLNIFLEMPFSPKKRLKIPKIYKKEPVCLKMFLRGLFDTDGSIHKENNYISFKSRDEKFAEEIRKSLIFLGLSPSRVHFDNWGIAGISIYSKDILNFSENIGFDHPRKKEILKNRVRRGVNTKVFKEFKKNIYVDGLLDMTLIKKIRVKGFGYKLKELRIQSKLTQKEFSKQLKISRRNYSRFETNELATPLKIYEKLLDRGELLKGLSKGKVVFGLSGHNFVKLKLKLSPKDKIIFKYLSPKKSTVTIFKRHPERLPKKENLEKQIEKMFNIKINTKSKQKIILSTTISKYLETFCSYKTHWEN